MMKKMHTSVKFERKLCSIFLIAIAFSLPAQTPIGQQPRNLQFTINDFVVSVDKVAGLQKKGRIGELNLHSYYVANPNKRYSGSGKITLGEKSIPVTFTNIKIRADRDNNLIATSGVVKGGGRVPVKYSLNDFNIAIKPKSLVIKPTTAKASVIVKVPLHSCSDDPLTSVNMSSDNCTVYSDGSIYGDDFLASGQFRLKKSVYTITASNAADGIINLGNKLADASPAKGAYFSCNETNNLFSCQCQIDYNSSAAKIRFELKTPVEKILEYNTGGDQFYFLKLNEGFIEFAYDADTLKECFGEFPAKVTLPKRFNKLADLLPNEIIDTLSLILYTDISNALFDTLDLFNKRTNDQYLFNLGPVTFKPEKNKAWLYFPEWITGGSTYDFIKEEPACDEMTDHLLQLNGSDTSRHDRNPGLTISRGTVFLRSPQVDYWYQGSITPEEATTLKTYFSGYLTFTPYGLHGSITSNGNTFVPFTYSMDSCEIHRNYIPASWNQIMMKGDTLPDEISELFRIEKLRILQMKLIEMPVCRDMIQTASTNFRYYVHFPYPTYLNLEFEDKSFDTNGRFNKAYGPLSNLIDEDLSYREAVIPSETEPSGKIETVQIPTSYYFWAWRLPVAFADRGIEIDHTRLRSEPYNSITIMMQNQSHNTLGEVYANELSIYPLYSDNSAFRKGVRFKGFLSSDGTFQIDSWDTKPFFGKYYSRKFKCDLNDIALADLASSPTNRPFDFKWDGKLQFPFFSGESANSWQPVYFQIKDLEHFMPSPVNIDRTSWQAYLCQNKQYQGSSPQPNPNESMTLTINNLVYNTKLGGFTCSNVVREEANQPGRLELYSYSHALFIVNQPVRVNKWLKVTRSNDCKYIKVSERLMDAISSDDISDLVCWDTLAAQSRGSIKNDSLCCGGKYYYGTYQIVAHNSNNDSTITLSASNAKYYPFELENCLSLENSKMIYKSGDNQTENFIDIPGMQLVQTEDGYYGAFGSTYTDVAFSLPYEGEFRFFLDPKCGYFYTLGAGSFTYAGITFRGQIFIMHAPRRVLDENPFNYNTTPLLNDMATRSLSDYENFVTDTQLGDIYSTSIITGNLSTAAATFGLNLKAIDISITAGLTNYLYFSDYRNSFNAGMFEVIKASAKVDLAVFSAEVGGDAKLALASSTEFNDFNDIFSSLTETDLRLSGQLELHGCINIIFLGHCCATVRAGASITNTSGLKLEGLKLGGCCDCKE